MRHLKPQDSVHLGKARMMVKPEEVNEADLVRYVRTDLGRLLLKARQEFVAAEGRFLDRDELEAEVSERSGDIATNCGG